ncbi:hypothetical protein F2Q68_00022367, partial [Brassica cretica]
MAAISSLFLVFTLFIVSLLTILALIVRPRPVKIPGGGSSGIGLADKPLLKLALLADSSLALAHLSASEGAGVSIFARSLSKLADAKRSIKLATGVEVATFSPDVRDYDAVSKSVHQSGPIDVLIVNQGVFIGKELEKQSTEEVKFMIDVNLVGSWSEQKKRPELYFHHSFIFRFNENQRSSQDMSRWYQVRKVHGDVPFHW